MEKLSGAYDALAAGLPRGRTSQLTSVTREQQRRRLIKGAITSFAEKGYTSTTITDIVKLARVSRQVFYEIFDTKEDCFLAAEELGRKALVEQVLSNLQHKGISGDQWIRSPIQAYLQLCNSEQQFTRAWAIEFPNAGQRCLNKRNEFFDELGQWLKNGHTQIKMMNPDHWDEVPDMFYHAAIGGVYEIIFRFISENKFHELTALEDDLVHFVQSAIGYRKTPLNKKT